MLASHMTAEPWRSDVVRRQILESAAAASSPTDAFYQLFYACNAESAFFYGVPSSDFLDRFCADSATQYITVQNSRCEPGLTWHDVPTAPPNPKPDFYETRYSRKYTYIGRPEWRKKVRFAWPNHWEGWQINLCDGDIHYWKGGGALKLQDRLISRAFVFEYEPTMPNEFRVESRFDLMGTNWGCIGIRKDFSPARTAAEHWAALDRESGFPAEGYGWGEGVEVIESI